MTRKRSKVATLKNFSASVDVAGTTFFDKSFLFHVITKIKRILTIYKIWCIFVWALSGTCGSVRESSIIKAKLENIILKIKLLVSSIDMCGEVKRVGVLSWVGHLSTSGAYQHVSSSILGTHSLYTVIHSHFIASVWRTNILELCW